MKKNSRDIKDKEDQDTVESLQGKMEELTERVIQCEKRLNEISPSNSQADFFDSLRKGWIFCRQFTLVIFSKSMDQMKTWFSSFSRYSKENKGLLWEKVQKSEKKATFLWSGGVLVLFLVAFISFYMGKSFSQPTAPDLASQKISENSKNKVIKNKVISFTDTESKSTLASSQSNQDKESGRIITWDTKKESTSNVLKKEDPVSSDPLELNTLIELGKKGNELERVEVARKLRDFPGETAGKQLARMLKDKSPEVRWNVIRSLSKNPFQGATDDLISIAEDLSQEKNLRAEAVVTLGFTGNLKATSTLSQILNDENELVEIRASAAEALGLLGNAQSSLILVEALDLKISEIQEAAANALGRFGYPKASAKLIRIMQNQKNSVFLRVAAINALGNIKERADKSAVVMVQIYKKTNLDPEIRDALARSLEELRSSLNFTNKILVREVLPE